MLATVACLAQDELPGFALIRAGSFEMADHHGFVDLKHGGDETPIHTVRLDASIHPRSAQCVAHAKKQLHLNGDTVVGIERP
jgi:hypothetical protein